MEGNLRAADQEGLRLLQVQGHGELNPRFRVGVAPALASGAVYVQDLPAFQADGQVPGGGPVVAPPDVLPVEAEPQDRTYSLSSMFSCIRSKSWNWGP